MFSLHHVGFRIFQHVPSLSPLSSVYVQIKGNAFRLLSVDTGSQFTLRKVMGIGP
jgi:hypothetical protein